MRQWLEDGFNQWGRPFFYVGVLTMLVGALHMMVADADLGAFSVKAGAIECFTVLCWGWMLRRGAEECHEEERPKSRVWISRDRAKRAIQAYFPDDAEEILNDINFHQRAE